MNPVEDKEQLWLDGILQFFTKPVTTGTKHESIWTKIFLQDPNDLDLTKLNITSTSDLTMMITFILPIQTKVSINNVKVAGLTNETLQKIFKNLKIIMFVFNQTKNYIRITESIKDPNTNLKDQLTKTMITRKINIELSEIERTAAERTSKQAI